MSRNVTAAVLLAVICAAFAYALWNDWRDR